MSQNLKVYRDLEFLGHANNDQNIRGNPMYEKVFFTDHFIADGDESDWVEGTDTASSTIAYGAALGGVLTITTSGTTLDLGEITHVVQWGCAKNCVMEARVKFSSIDDVAMAVGFADAALGSSNKIAAEMSSAALVASRATEFAGLLHDTNSSYDYWYYGAYKAGNIGTPVITAVAPLTTAYQNLRVAMNTDGDATFYINGVAVGFLPTCVTTGTLLTPYVGFMARTGSEKIGYVDRITMWQDE